MLVSCAPTLEIRAQKLKNTKRVPGTSGRLHRTEAGDWVWSSDDESDDKTSDESAPNTATEPPSSVAVEPQQQVNSLPATEVQAQEQNPVQQTNSASSDENIATLSTESSSLGQLINLVLRIRNQKRELNDIRFEFVPDRDTADGIAAELVGAGLVDGKDIIVVAANLQKLVDNLSLKSLVFALNPGANPSDVPDEKALIGFAQLSITTE